MTRPGGTGGELRIGVLGAGAWGKNHVRVVAQEAGGELRAVADPDPRALEEAGALAAGVARAPAVRLERDPRAVLAAPDIDAVVIAAPAVAHADLAAAALAAGKHVLVEKPLALEVGAARRLADAARRAERIGMVGHLMVYHPAVARLGALLRSGELGRLHYLHSTRVNLGRLRRDENALWSFGPHDLSMLDHLLDQQPVSVAARGQCVLQPGIEDVVFLTLRYPGGEMAHVHLSWLSPRKERRLTLVCSQKMAEFDDVAADKLRIYDKGYDPPPPFTEYGEFLTIRDGEVRIPRLPMQEPLRLQHQAFLRAIADRRPPATDLDSGARVVAVLAAAQRSLAQDGRPVLLQDLDNH